MSIFLRRGKNGTYTRLFNNLEAAQKSTVLAILDFDETELPVIGSVRDSDNWLVLTTERLVWSIGGTRREIAASAIRGATADLRQLGSDGKLGMQRLQVVAMGGEEHSIELEPGAPLSGVWNILINLGKRNRNLIAKPK